jgi:hypothetical protein
MATESRGRIGPDDAARPAALARRSDGTVREAPALADRAVDDPRALLELQRLAGNSAVGELLAGRPPDPGLPVQRAPATDAVVQALDRPDPVAGVGDFNAAWRTLNGLGVEDLLATGVPLVDR